jgi:cellulose synthase/poly-beta-1,6-N-acetylglucosamine synthase-like glycosyltransferase
VIYLIIYAILIASTAVSFAYYVLNSYGSLKYSKEIRNKNVDLSTVTISIPVYNEDPEVFKECIDAVKRQGCKFLVVGDSSLDPYRTIVEERGGAFVYLKEHGGKKKAMQEAMKHVNTEFVVLMDSDTILPENAVSNMLSHFDLNVGGVGANIGIKKTGSSVSYCSEFVERSREVVFRAMSAHGSVMNLDGACSTYRTEIIRPFISSNEFLGVNRKGKTNVLGEDWLLTGHVIRSGYTAVKDYETRVESYPPKDFRKFLKQNIRWSRSGWRRFGKELTNGTAAKAGKFYTFELVYTYMLPIIALAFIIFRGYHFLEINYSYLVSFNIYGILTPRHFEHVGYFLYSRIGMEFVDLFGTGIFVLGIVDRIKTDRLKTLMYGAVAMAIIFATTIYGLATFWKTAKWLSR